MPAQRQVARDGEGRLADRAAVDDARLHPAVRLRQLDPAALLELDVHPHRLAVRDVHRDLGRAAGADHDARRQGAPPGRSRTSVSAARTDSSVCAATPSAASTASIESRVTTTC